MFGSFRRCAVLEARRAERAGHVDPSHFLKEGNTYLMYREHACDIMSFHSYPAIEDPMWVYLEP
ncbi:MAG: hypothetical protein CM1200mP2_26210 [Planctomycetaceae bacterium]|nr:MAG: hypothetical protein CM1200mP2_26210 [Planctomycetaceae bacterium]